MILFDGPQRPDLSRPGDGGTKAVAIGLDRGRHENERRMAGVPPDGRHYLYLVTTEKAEDTRTGRLDRLEGEAKLVRSDAREDRLRVFLFAAIGPSSRNRSTRRRSKSEGSRSRSPRKSEPTTWASPASPCAQRVLVTGPRSPPAGSSGGSDRAGARPPEDPGVYKNPAISPTGDRLAYNSATSDGKQTSGSGTSPAASRRGQPGRETTSAPSGLPTGRDRLRFGPGEVRTLREVHPGQSAKSDLYTATKTSCDFLDRDGGTSPSRREPEDEAGVWALPTFGDQNRSRLQRAFTENVAMLCLRGYIATCRTVRRDGSTSNVPGGGGRWQVSTRGRLDPSWRGEGKEPSYRRSIRSHGGRDPHHGEFQAEIRKLCSPHRGAGHYPQPVQTLLRTASGSSSSRPRRDGARSDRASS